MAPNPYSRKYYCGDKNKKTYQEQPHLLSGHFIRRPLLRGPNSGHLIQV